MFLPLGAAWSLDARRRGPPTTTQVFSAGSVAFIVQLSLVYWVAGWAKWNDDWLSGEALGNVFGFGLYGTSLGQALIEYPALNRWLSRSVVWLELLGPLALFSPWSTARWRMLAVIGFSTFHVAIAATITLGLFSYAAVATWLALLPGEFWEWVGARVVNKVRQPNEAKAIPPLAPRFEGGGLAGACCWAALALILYWNVSYMTRWRLPATGRQWVSLAANATGLHQTWAVFGHPPKYDCWFVYQARLQDGRTVDLLTGEPARAYERPPLGSREFTNHRWRKLHSRLPQRAGEPYREPLADYFRRRWNDAHPPQEQVVQLDLYCYRQALEQGRPANALTRESLARISVGEQGGAFAEAARELDL
jgi:hypothetical protein